MKNSFLIYHEYKEHFELLSDEELGRFMRGIMSYEIDGVLPEFDGMLKMAFSFVRAQLDRDTKKYEEVKGKRSKAGQKSAEQRQTKATCVESDEHAPTKATVNVDVDVDVDVKDNVKDKTQKKRMKNKDIIVCDNVAAQFEVIWGIYPNKQGKQAALSHFDNALKNGVAFETIHEGVQNYAFYVQQKAIEQKYIKHGSTWFNQRCWEDDYTVIAEKEKTTNPYFEMLLEAKQREGGLNVGDECHSDYGVDKGELSLIPNTTGQQITTVGRWAYD